MSKKLLLQLAQSLAVAIVVAIGAYFQAFDIPAHFSGTTAAIAGLVIGVVVRLCGAVVGYLGSKSAA